MEAYEYPQVYMVNNAWDIPVTEAYVTDDRTPLAHVTPHVELSNWEKAIIMDRDARIEDARVTLEVRRLLALDRKAARKAK